MSSRGSVDLDTHGPDWRQKVRTSAIFVALVTPHWLRDAFAQRQLAYAQRLGKPIYLLIKQGTSVPATVAPKGQRYYWSSSEDLGKLTMEIVEGQR